MILINGGEGVFLVQFDSGYGLLSIVLLVRGVVCWALTSKLCEVVMVEMVGFEGRGWG